MPSVAFFPVCYVLVLPFLFELFVLRELQIYMQS